MHTGGVFSGSNTSYATAARALGEEIASRDLRLVYGGAGVGLMGIVADAVLAARGTAVGVIPQQLVDEEIAHRVLSELQLTGTMHERNALMADLSDGFIALPGGYGTPEEFAEALTWPQVGIQHKPCGLLDFSDRAVAEGFTRAEHRRESPFSPHRSRRPAGRPRDLGATRAPRLPRPHGTSHSPRVTTGGECQEPVVRTCRRPPASPEPVRRELSAQRIAPGCDLCRRISGQRVTTIAVINLLSESTGRPV